MKNWYSTIPLCLTILMMACQSNAGILSKTVIKTGKEVTKRLGSKGAKELVQQTVDADILKLTKKFGADTVRRIEDAALHTGIPKEKLLQEAASHPNVYRRAGFAADALQFGLKHGARGRRLINDPDLFASMRSGGWLKDGAEDVVREADRLANGVGGSVVKLQKALNNAENTGVLSLPKSRWPFEPLFAQCIKKGKIRDSAGNLPLPKGTEAISGHINNGPHGCDLFAPEPNGPLRIIELGTGTKPSSIEEVSWPRLRENLQKFVNSSDKIWLRSKGWPEPLLNPSRLGDDFPIHDFVTRIVCAPQINGKLARQIQSAPLSSLGPIHFHKLP